MHWFEELHSNGATTKRRIPNEEAQIRSLGRAYSPSSIILSVESESASIYKLVFAHCVGGRVNFGRGAWASSYGLQVLDQVVTCQVSLFVIFVAYYCHFYLMKF